MKFNCFGYLLLRNYPQKLLAQRSNHFIIFSLMLCGQCLEGLTCFCSTWCHPGCFKWLGAADMNGTIWVITLESLFSGSPGFLSCLFCDHFMWLVSLGFLTPGDLSLVGLPRARNCQFPGRLSKFRPDTGTGPFLLCLLVKAGHQALAQIQWREFHRP